LLKYGSTRRRSLRGIVIPTHGKTLACSLTLAAFVTALAVLCLGLPRMLVVCTGPHCDARVQFAHAQGGCCDHDHEDAASADPDGDGPEGPCCEDHGHCVDQALGIGVGPLPERVGVDREPPPRAQVATTAPPPGPEVEGTVMRPPTTGPPRPDPRTALLASTVLLL
jgi:hypothetical protein